MRADVYLFARGEVKSRRQAKDFIESGYVAIDGEVVKKASAEIDDGIEHIISVRPDEKYVSRGGLKLEAALETFAIDVGGMTALDIGASTGGFTDCLLRRGAKNVVAVDSGHGQLDPTLRCDARVVSYEKYNARELSVEIVPGGADIVTMDVSFISQTLIIPGLSKVMKPEGIFVTLIKPQFEAGRSAVGKGGVVKSRADRLAAVLRVADAAGENNLVCRGLMLSPIKGGDGNIEYLAYFTRGGVGLTTEKIKRAVYENSGNN